MTDLRHRREELRSVLRRPVTGSRPAWQPPDDRAAQAAADLPEDMRGEPLVARKSRPPAGWAPWWYLSTQRGTGSERVWGKFTSEQQIQDVINAARWLP